MFTREDTKAVKGLAIVLMLLHHMVTWSSRWPVGFEGFNPPRFWPSFESAGYLADLGWNAIICVPIFFFLGGYGLYKRWEAGKFHLGGAILSIYKQFWKVFLIFIPVAFLFFARSGEGINDLCTRYNINDAKEFIKTLLGNFTGYDITLNREWWFLPAYVCTLSLGCLFCAATRNHKYFLADIFLVFGIDVVTQVVLPGLAGTAALSALGSNFYYPRFLKLNNFAPSLFMGITFAKYDLLTKLKRRISGVALRVPLCLAGMLFVFCFRVYAVHGSGTDTLVTPLFIVFASVLFDCAKPLKTCFQLLGRHSTNMWLVHSFYCYYFLEVTKIVYSTRSVLADLDILIALSLATSILLNLFYGVLGRLWSRLRPALTRRRAAA